MFVNFKRAEKALVCKHETDSSVKGNFEENEVKHCQVFMAQVKVLLVLAEDNENVVRNEIYDDDYKT